MQKRFQVQPTRVVSTSALKRSYYCGDQCCTRSRFLRSARAPDQFHFFPVRSHSRSAFFFNSPLALALSAHAHVSRHLLSFPTTFFFLQLVNLSVMSYRSLLKCNRCSMNPFLSPNHAGRGRARPSPRRPTINSK